MKNLLKQHFLTIMAMYYFMPFIIYILRNGDLINLVNINYQVIIFLYDKVREELGLVTSLLLPITFLIRDGLILKILSDVNTNPISHQTHISKKLILSLIAAASFKDLTSKSLMYIKVFNPIGVFLDPFYSFGDQIIITIIHTIVPILVLIVWSYLIYKCVLKLAYNRS